jgi:hypothetical protein
MDIDIHTLNKEAQLMLVEGLTKVLDSRTHKRVVMGDEITVKGSLSKALKLPNVCAMLNSSHTQRQENGHQQLAEIWSTLSPSTKERTLALLGWYEPKDLPWDDPRSNRKPQITKE